MDVTDRAPDLSQQEILENEDALLESVLGAAREIKETARLVRITRDGQTRFQFYVRGLSGDEREEAQRRFTEYERTRGGMRLPDLSTSKLARQRALQVYLATTDRDKARLWDKDALRARLVDEELLGKSEANDPNRLRRGAAVVNAVLYGNEIDEIVEMIDEIGGASMEREERAGK